MLNPNSPEHTQLMRASLDCCVKCTICETVCPVAAVTPLFPGPKFVGPQAERYRHGMSVDHSLDYCSSCGACTLACPQGVHIAEINSIARAAMKADHMPVRDRLVSDTVLQGTFLVPFAPIANAVLSNKPARTAIEKVIGIHRNAPMPKAVPHKLKHFLKKRTKRQPLPEAPQRGSIVFFHGCAARYYEQETAVKAIDVLELLGYEVLVPDQGCCGLPKQSNGLFDAARKDLRRLVDQLRTSSHELPIVSISTSCAGMLKREAWEILGVHDDSLRDVSTRTTDICELLMDLHREGTLPVDAFQALDIVVPYHPPCQLKSHGMGLPAIELMELVPGVTVRETEAACCGMAGTYGIKQEKYNIAMAVGKPVFDHVSKVTSSCQGDPKLAVCDSETCRWQIETATGVRTVHPIQIIHAALGLSQL